MGHIVNAHEFEKIRNNNCQISSVPSAPSTPPPRQQCQNLSTQQIGKARRLQTNVGVSSWGECVQSVSNLLPAPYAERWLNCLEQLLHNEGPLPESWRIYIAILALCRHEVTWAVRALTFEFISADGDRKWLSGLRFAPKKLRALTPINNILAHRPWLLTSEHILDLTKGEESWSISELCQALCLITHFHSFASFLHACLPLPNPPPHSQSPPTPPPPPPPPPPSAPPSLSSSSSQSNSLPLTPRASPAKAILPSSLPDKLKPLALPLKLPSPVDSLEISEGEIIPVKAASDSSTIDAHMKTPSDTDTDSATTTTSVTNGGGTVSMPVVVKKNKEQPHKGTTTTSLTNGDSVSMPVLVKKHKELNGTTTKNLTNGSTVSMPVLITKNKEQLNGMKGNGNGSTVGGSKREIQTSPQPNKQSKNESNSTRSVSCKEETPSSLREFPHLCHDLSYAYEEFTWPWIFKILDFNWQDHGYCLMTRLLNEMGNLIDERLGAVKTISHPAWVKSEEGNAYLYRRAVWIYIQSLYGIFHESYSYPQIDSHLRQEVKDFIKTCCCRPETLEGKVPPQLLGTSDKHPSQLVPLSILIMEARTESGLLYALRAIIPHQC